MPLLLDKDTKVKEKFQEFVKRGIKRDEKEILNVLALALIDNRPKEILAAEYLESLTGDSLQSVEELRRVSDAIGLNNDTLFNRDKMNELKDAFQVRNEIIHEMDINVVRPQGSKAYRTRRQRRAPQMERHTKNVLNLAEDFFIEVKKKF